MASREEGLLPPLEQERADETEQQTGEAVESASTPHPHSLRFGGQNKPTPSADDHKFKRPAVPSKERSSSASTVVSPLPSAAAAVPSTLPTSPSRIITNPKRGSKAAQLREAAAALASQQYASTIEPGPSHFPPGQPLPPLHQLSPAQVQQYQQQQMHLRAQQQAHAHAGIPADVSVSSAMQLSTLRQVAQQQQQRGNVYAVRSLHPSNPGTLIATPHAMHHQQTGGQVILGQRYYDSGRCNAGMPSFSHPSHLPIFAPPPLHSTPAVHRPPVPYPETRYYPQQQQHFGPGTASGRGLSAGQNVPIGAMLRGPAHPTMGRGAMSGRGVPPSAGVGSISRIPPGAAPLPYRTAPAVVYPPHFINEKDGMVMSKVVWSGDQFYIPSILTNCEWILRKVLNAEVYENLPEKIKTYLRQFFPRNVPNSTPEDEKAILKAAFTGRRRQTAGNPMSRFYTKLHAGWFNPEKQSELVQLKDNSRVLYDHYIRFYHINLLKQLAVSRHILLEQHLGFGPDEEPAKQPLDAVLAAKKRHFKKIKSRAAKRAKLMLADCRQKVGEFGFSSDEEADNPISKALTTVTAKSTLYSMSLRDLDLHQPTQIDDLKKMLKMFKKLQEKDPQDPTLSIGGIDLDEVFERAGIQAQSQKIKETVESLESSLRDRIEEI